jgi:hypothetical protein
MQKLADIQQKKSTDITCSACGTVFSTKFNKIRHERKYCDTDIKKNNTSSDMSLVLKQNQQLIDLLVGTSHTLNTNAQTLNTHANTNDKSVRAMSFIMKYFTKTKAINKIKENEIKGMLTYEGDLNITMEDLLIKYYDKGKLNKFIGDMITEKYIPENPAEQSIWATDTTRLNFTIRQIVKSTNKCEWLIDKTGSKFKDLIITPIMNKVHIMLKEYVSKLTKQHDTDMIIDDEYFNTYRATKTAKILQSGTEIMISITNKDLHDEILKYVAPSFGLDIKIVDIKKVINYNNELTSSEEYSEDD